ncbi:MAG: hypothetical protein JW744_01420 [Candidatus Diapherotrites archaeon]|uniref:Uncharacterized protein n=1 Tax=Candidatus Iainarchaeum sp. TaxID=3101447 RepID=A0A938YWS9_9ARCH|nr:hypothetical protein [Candidatus Diapherotrites archaeon]
MKREIAIAALLVALAAAGFLLSPALHSHTTGFFTIYFECNNNGLCNPGEAYSDCPNDCCDADCSANADTICHSTCSGYGGCSNFVAGCDGLATTTRICLNSQTWVQCCSSSPVACSANEYCVSGSCSGCSTACDNVCQSTACFGIDPDCDAAGNATGTCCGDADCDGSETCITCPGDCPGAFECTSDLDCNDGNTLTTDACLNPGACNSDCNHVVCTIECNSDAGCNDNNALTTDTCLNPGTCSSDCNHTVCHVACNSAAGCDDSNSLTADTCANAGSCSASCSYSACSVACNSAAGCDDSNSLTTDVCNNPGTCSASCSHNVSCTPACDSNSACNDSNSLTTDICLNPGTCSASCSNEPCSIACYADLNCNDNNSSSGDSCVNPGTCSAYCSYQSCSVECQSNSDCDDGLASTNDQCFFPGGCDSYCNYAGCVIACTENTDCFDSDPATVDSCSNPGTCDAACSNMPCSVACSSDADCGDSNPITLDVCSNAGECDASCSHEEQNLISIEPQPGLDRPLLRGETVPLLVTLRDPDGALVGNALVSVTDALGNEFDLNSLGDGNYSLSYPVPVDLPLGEQRFAFFASTPDMIGSKNVLLDVNSGIIRAVLLRPESLFALPGEKLEFKFKLVYDNNSAVQNPDVNASLNGISIALQSDGNSFTGSYLFSDADLGTAVLSIFASDSLGNSGLSEFAFTVQQPFPWFLVLLLAVLAVGIALFLYWFVRHRRMLSLEGKRGKLALSKKKTQLQKAVAANATEKDLLGKKLLKDDKKLKVASKELGVERKRQALASRKLPSEMRYAAHKALVSLSLLPKRARKLFSKPAKLALDMDRDRKLKKLDLDISDLRNRIQNLEAEFCKQTIKEDYFRERLFEYREKIHLLELEKRKL